MMCDLTSNVRYLDPATATTGDSQLATLSRLIVTDVIDHHSLERLGMIYRNFPGSWISNVFQIFA